MQGRLAAPALLKSAHHYQSHSSPPAGLPECWLFLCLAKAMQPHLTSFHCSQGGGKTTGEVPTAPLEPRVYLPGAHHLCKALQHCKSGNKSFILWHSPSWVMPQCVVQLFQNHAAPMARKPLTSVPQRFLHNSSLPCALSFPHVYRR